MKNKDLRAEKVAEPARSTVPPQESALKGFEGRVSAVLFPLLVVVAIVAGVLLWG